jgi:flagellar basal-body rod protein FlgC
MNLMDALKIGSSGLTAQRIRMNVISSNLANVNSTWTEDGGPYRKKQVIMGSSSFGDMLERAAGDPLAHSVAAARVMHVNTDNSPLVSKYDPHHPDADAGGYVKMPNVNLIEEMVEMLNAARSYEANITTLNTTKEMAMKALEIGR